jgi:hypothetical protein
MNSQSSHRKSKASAPLAGLVRMERPGQPVYRLQSAACEKPAIRSSEFVTLLNLLLHDRPRLWKRYVDHDLG